MFIVMANALIFSILGGFHLYWVFGGQRGMNVAVPTDREGQRLFEPSKQSTLIVALGLFGFAWLNLAVVGMASWGLSTTVLRYALLAIALVFAIRSMGDFRYVGFGKKFKTSPFARMDTAFFSPLCLLLALTHIYLFYALSIS
ncbi:DUF3995 domain-containing protein [Flavobacterium sp. JP2137]|uniref:DUF3995 domain-containing protein n=1 Tax=Flavobacterium sp. JP2137 TaxID=3414510 RepID=UPI003D300062